MSQARKQQRKPIDERREALIDATIRCLKRGGLEAASVRKISAEAGISVGLINHHFASKEDLIAAAYRVVAVDLLESTWREALAAGEGAREQLSGFFRGSFAVYMRDPGALKTWMAFWTLTEQSPQVKSVHDETYRNYRAHLEDLLTRLCEDPEEVSFDVRLAAIGLSAILDGLWLELCLNPTTFSPEEGVRLCETWVDGLVSGAYRHLVR